MTGVTVYASANVARTDRPTGRTALPFADVTLGQNLKLRILRQIDQQRYEVSFAGRQQIVESRVPLTTGTQIEARVESKGDRLKLRYLSTDARFVDEDLAEDEASVATPDADLPAPPPWLNELAGQFRVPLDAQAQVNITALAEKSAEPQLAARAGFFLQKLVKSVSTQDLEAMYRVLSTGVPAAAARSAAVDFDALPVDSGDTIADLIDNAARDAAEARVPTMGDAESEARSNDDGRRALRLLNLQDEGSVAWRYGTLPILVGGQLVELDLVMFRERQQPDKRGGLRRLVMTLETTHFGRVRVEARAVDDRLLVKLQAPTADAVEVLSAYGQDVRAAIERLGWQVDDIGYEIDAQAGRAAQAVIDHVLSTGSVDREL